MSGSVPNLDNTVCNAFVACKCLGVLINSLKAGGSLSLHIVSLVLPISLRLTELTEETLIRLAMG